MGRYDTQHNDGQHNDPQHDYTQNNDTQHIGTQRQRLTCDNQHTRQSVYMTLSVHDTQLHDTEHT